MKLEEAKANIGKEVVYVGRNKEAISAFNGRKLLIVYPTRSMNENVLIEYDELCFWNIPPQDLKLKEQPMNYKIKVTPETSAEVQELFFELGCVWVDDRLGNKNTAKYTEKPYVYIDANKYITFSSKGSHLFFEGHTNQEITLPQLREMVVLNRNSVGDATHEDNYGMLWFIGCSHYLWNFESKRWIKEKPMYLRFKEIKKLENISVEVVATEVECKKEMTWHDALRAVADGKEVEVKNISWFDINDLKLGQIKKGKAFRIKPKTIHIDGGNYSKEELLKIAGDMK